MIVSGLLPATISQKIHGFTVDMVVCTSSRFKWHQMFYSYTQRFHRSWHWNRYPDEMKCMALRTRTHINIYKYSHRHIYTYHYTTPHYIAPHECNNVVFTAIVNVPFDMKMNEWMNEHNTYNVDTRSFTHLHTHTRSVNTHASVYTSVSQLYETVISCYCW